jgi:hypothetical protein
MQRYTNQYDPDNRNPDDVEAARDLVALWKPRLHKLAEHVREGNQTAETALDSAITLMAGTTGVPCIDVESLLDAAEAVQSTGSDAARLRCLGVLQDMMQDYATAAEGSEAR